ncbi:MAG: chemotaxis-specific protein-glutamate methyltransferase CheB [Proteobacteria bacterium]|nr:chemotaxis-specific protein-glutamate methyltransferase CheB [Pseudomonadota bacterium]
MKFKNVLVIEDEPELNQLVSEELMESGFNVQFALDTFKAEKILDENKIDLVVSDNHIPGRTGIAFFEHYKAKNPNCPNWVFMSADGTPEFIEKAIKLGAIDFLQKPFKSSDLMAAISRINDREEDPLHEIMHIVQSIAGIQLGKDKILLAETRIMRRARMLGLSTIKEYLKLFKENRSEEVKEIVSIMTTHTTEFFREPDHFDYLFDKVYPNLVNQKEPITFWSAACSSGEELYSLAISFFEYAREKGIPREKLPKVKFVGTDIDFASCDKARKGIYHKSLVDKIHPNIQKIYFEFGTGDLAELVKVQDYIVELCQFEQGNLLSPELPVKNVDIIFLRNVLIYFKGPDIETIAKKMERALSPRGILFLGHSESLSNLKSNFGSVGNSIYKTRDAIKKESEAKSLSLKQGSSNVTKLPEKKKSVFIIDDSSTVRLMLKKILSSEHGFEVIGEAENPVEAEEKLKKLKPDLITLDIHMPKMDGITYLESIKNRKNPPIVMISSINYDDAVSSLKCFELGAVDYIEKPNGLNLEAESERIREVLRGACNSKQIESFRTTSTPGVDGFSSSVGTDCLIALGASTGGVEALTQVLSQFPEKSPPIVITQHMPQHFTEAFAKRLSSLCKIKVTEGKDGEKVEASHAYIAPGGKQMKIVEQVGALVLKVTDDAPVNRHKPSVDYLFDSVCALSKSYRVSAALLTGMGADGARGLKKLKDCGVHTIAQNEETCVVFGMPKEAIALGGACEVLPLPSVSYHLFQAFKRKVKSAA